MEQKNEKRKNLEQDVINLKLNTLEGLTSALPGWYLVHVSFQNLLQLFINPSQLHHWRHHLSPSSSSSSTPQFYKTHFLNTQTNNNNNRECNTFWKHKTVLRIWLLFIYIYIFCMSTVKCAVSVELSGGFQSHLCCGLLFFNYYYDFGPLLFF